MMESRLIWLSRVPHWAFLLGLVGLGLEMCVLYYLCFFIFLYLSLAFFGFYCGGTWDWEWLMYDV